MPTASAPPGFTPGFFRSPFVPALLLSNPHAQTLFPQWHRAKGLPLERQSETVMLADGDEIRLDLLLPDAPDPQCGLHFICLNASIARQFEFIQGAWLQSAKFGGLSDERDPVVGTRVPSAEGGATDRFGMPGESGATRRLEGMPNFVSVAGGAYFFLPSKRALKFIACQTGD